MDAAKVKRLEEYSMVLERQAENFESRGDDNEAAKIYVKLVDVLLLLARETPDHPTWVKYSARAEAFQKKAKEAIAKSHSESDSLSQQGKTGAIKRIFGLKSGEERPAPYELKLDKTYEQTPLQAKAPVAYPGALATHIQPQEPMIAKRLYDQLLEKNKQFESQIASMVESSEYNRLEGQCKELNEKLADTVPRTDYEELRQRLEASIPRAQYEDLQNMLVNFVPKDAAQARISELESQLANSIPRSVIDNLANEISLLAVTAIIPIELIGAREEALSDLGMMSSDIKEEKILSIKQRLRHLELEK